MAKNSSIEWTDNSFNPWWGCRRVSPACDRCYAAAFSKRVGSVGWVSGAFRTFGEKHWSEPLTWDRKARAADRRERVFCASMADVFDAEAPSHERAKPHPMNARSSGPRSAKPRISIGSCSPSDPTKRSSCCPVICKIGLMSGSAAPRKP